MAHVVLTPPGGGTPKNASGPFQGWGTSLAWFAHATGKDAALRELICTELFDPKKLGLNIVRYNIGGTAKDPHDAHRFRTGGAVPCCSDPEGGYDGALDEAQTSYLLRARELISPETFISEAFCNSPPYFLVRSGTSRGNTKPFRNNLAKEEVPKFVDTMFRALAHFKSQHNLVFDSLSPFNEPGSPAWVEPIAVQECCYFSHGRMNDVLKALYERREELGTTIVAAHEQFSVADGARDARRTGKKLWPAIGRVNVHTYDSSEFIDKAPWFVTKTQDNRFQRAALRSAAAKAGRDLWVSEYGTGKGAAGLAAHMVRDLSTLLPTAWIYWQAVEEPGSTWGLVQAPLKDDCACDGAAAAPEAAPKAQAGPKSVSRTPQYHVMKRIMAAVPLGSRLFAVPALKRRGVGVWLGPNKAAFILVHPAREARPLIVKLDASLLREGGAFAAAEAAGGGAAAAAPGEEAPGGALAEARTKIKGVARMTDLVALDAAGKEAGAAGVEGFEEQLREFDMDDEGADTLQVSPGFMCIVELASA
ncbi:hypothetical protein Rsub_05485 [Raphidocelis subcapitata]|uniref:Endo-beta-1,6-galactanase-like domain-containing protein n=1 Tax=Raphidocelis subcapitata TaxID=307507 RepID=A0A2V0NZ21_9CHLO|nr:hypothetical protein Rsub_05485 [Raphidocelis subcapitata]|eukprot:GBF92866.1 hypothetical protein Rsub_05485 [Raphidocelis subcapitata]